MSVFRHTIFIFASLIFFMNTRQVCCSEFFYDDIRTEERKSKVKKMISSLEKKEELLKKRLLNSEKEFWDHLLLKHKIAEEMNKLRSDTLKKHIGVNGKARMLANFFLGCDDLSIFGFFDFSSLSKEKLEDFGRIKREYSAAEDKRNQVFKDLQSVKKDLRRAKKGELCWEPTTWS